MLPIKSLNVSLVLSPILNRTEYGKVTKNCSNVKLLHQIVHSKYNFSEEYMTAGQWSHYNYCILKNI